MLPIHFAWIIYHILKMRKQQTMKILSKRSLENYILINYITVMLAEQNQKYVIEYV